MGFKASLTGCLCIQQQFWTSKQVTTVARRAMKLAVMTSFLLGSGISLAQCTYYLPAATAFPYSYPGTQVISGTSTAPNGTVTPFSVTHPFTYSVVSPYSYAYVLNANQDAAFTACSGQPLFSGSGSGTVGPSAQNNFYTNNVSAQVANGTLNIVASGNRTQPPNDGNTYTAYSAEYAYTIVYSIKTGAFSLTEEDSSSANYCCDASGDVISINETGSGSASGTWPIVQTVHGYSQVQKADYGQLAEFWLQKSAYSYQLFQGCSQVELGGHDQGIVNCKLLLDYAGATAALGMWYNNKAADPPDPDYTSIAQPVTPTIPLPPTDASWTASQLAAYDAYKAYIQNSEQIIGLTQAEITCVNRAEGALNAGDAYWVQQQVAAFQRYADLEAFDLQLLIPQISQLKQAYSQSGFPDFSVSIDQATQFEQEIAINGLDPSFQQELLALGIDSNGLGSLGTAWSSLDPSTISGDYLASLAVPTSTIQQLEASFVFPFSSFSPKTTIFELLFPNTSLNAFEVSGFFTLGSTVSNFDPTTQDTSLGLGAFAVTIPAGSFHKSKNGNYEFLGIINGVSLLTLIQPTPAGYQFWMDGFGVGRTSLPDHTNPVSVAFQIGSNGSSTSVSVDYGTSP